MNRIRLDHVSLLVSNLDRSCDFYLDVVQLAEVPCKIGVDYIRWFALGPVQTLHVIGGEFGDTKVPRSTHFCISTDRFEDFKAHLKAKGVPWCNTKGEAFAENHRLIDNVRQIYFQDPDGYWIEVNTDY